MSNKPIETTLTEPVQCGKVYYQLFKEVWPTNGDVRFFARIGRPWHNKQAGTSGIISKLYSGGVSDFIRAAQEIEPQLNAFRKALSHTIGTPTNSKEEPAAKLELVSNT